MRKWIDQSTFDELLLANAEDNIERAIQGASAVLEAVQEFVPEAALFYRVTHAVDSLKNYFEEACAGFRRNGILFLVRKYTYPKPYYDSEAEVPAAGASEPDAALNDGRIRAKLFFCILDKVLCAFLFVNSIDVVFVQFEMLPHDILDIGRGCHIFAADFLNYIQYLSLGVDTYI